jgi:Glucosidase II beta subunit-like
MLCVVSVRNRTLWLVCFKIILKCTGAVLYPPGENFTCFNGLRVIKFKQVNDEFCDCEDGSDEPGRLLVIKTK